MKTILDELRLSLSTYGLDLCQAFPVEIYNLDEQCSQYPLPIPSSASRKGSISDSHLGIVIGNSKAMWEPFLLHLSSDPERICNAENPIHDYVAEAIEKCLRSLTIAATFEIRYPYDEGSKFIHFQRLAHLSGLAYHNKNCFLCVSPEHGPWIALRAVIVFDMEGPSLLTFPKPLENPYPEGDAILALKTQSLMEEYRSNYTEGFKLAWEKLVEIRTICGGFLKDGGINQKYSHYQLRYHYLKSKSILFEALDAMNEQ